MNRNTRTLIVLSVAVVTAALASVGMYVVITRIARKPEPPKVFAVVAKKDLQMGATVAEADVKLIEWPHDSLVAGAYTSVDQVRDHALLSDVLENEPLTEGKLAKEGSGLTPQIDPGYRAISIKVNEVIGVSGFVTPGTRVDVVVTIRQNLDARSRIVVQNVKVLTAGAKYDDPEARKQGKPIPSTAVTLMVTPDEAERIAVAQTQGQIALTLRNPLDSARITTTGVSANAMMNVGLIPPPPPPPGGTSRGGGGTARGGGSTTGRGGAGGDSGPKTPICQFETFKAGKREVLPCS